MEDTTYIHKINWLAARLGKGWVVRRIYQGKKGWEHQDYPLLEKLVYTKGNGTRWVGRILRDTIGMDAIRDEILIFSRTPIHNPENFIDDVGMNMVSAWGCDRISPQIGSVLFASMRPWIGKEKEEFSPDEILEFFENISTIDHALIFSGSDIGMLKPGMDMSALMAESPDRKDLQAFMHELGNTECESPEKNSLREDWERIKSCGGKTRRNFVDEMYEAGADIKSADAAAKILDGMSDDDKVVTYSRNMLQLPWSKRITVNSDIARIRQAMSNSLYGLEDAKGEVLKAVAGSMLSSTQRFSPPRLLLHGTPGTGKTALAKAIAAGLELPLQRIAMNSISDAPSIIGCEPLYQSPQMGKIMNALITAECRNPVILLDELEKCGPGGKNGSPMNALHQALDPDENAHFTDLYFGVPFDISEVFFIATCNDISAIPASIIDRFTVIDVPEYTLEDKRVILPMLINQLTRERNLPVKPVMTAKALKLFDGYIERSSLRRIKADLWGMLCDAAIESPDINAFASSLVITDVQVSRLLAKGDVQRSKPKIGFV